MSKDCALKFIEPSFFFFKQKTAYEIGLGIPAEPLFRSYWSYGSCDPRQQEPYDQYHENSHAKHWDYHKTPLIGRQDRKSGSAGMPRPISYAVFCLKKKNKKYNRDFALWKTTKHGEDTAKDSPLSL